jgi:hypothetical protein
MNDAAKQRQRHAYVDYLLEQLLRDELYLPTRELLRRARVHYSIQPTEFQESMARLQEKKILAGDTITVNRFAKKQAMY